MSIISLIGDRQNALTDESEEMPVHEPEMLLIGCVDARKDPIDDLGIPKGKSLILRNVAALVHPEHHKRLTESAALAFAVRHMKVKHIAVMGHTDCGGIRAAIEGISSYSLRDYLEPIHEMSARVASESDDPETKRRLVEQEAVRYSINSLQTYDYIVEAEEKGELQLHGWVIDIATGKMFALNRDTGEFEPFTKFYG
ncbi:MAG: hypothetical protein MRY32_08805 [Rickettsiales bacterium]|nr:hypothetical protein [Rickettsiales bacterium]